MPTDELSKLLNRQRGKVDGDGATFESAPMDSGSDFAHPRRQVQQASKESKTSRKVCQGDDSEMQPNGNSTGQCEATFDHPTGVSKTVRGNTLDSLGSDQEISSTSQSYVGSSHNGASLLRKRREEVDKAGETWESAPTQSSTDFISAHRQPSEAEVILQANTDAITSFVQDGDHSASSLIQKRREKVDAAGETWESAPVQSSTDFVAAETKVPIKSSSLNVESNTGNVNSLLEGDVSGQEVLRKLREKVDAKAQVCESTPVVSSTDAVAPTQVFNLEVQDSARQSPATGPCHRVSTSSLQDSLTIDFPQMPEQKPDTIGWQESHIDTRCNESVPPSVEEGADGVEPQEKENECPIDLDSNSFNECISIECIESKSFNCSQKKMEEDPRLTTNVDATLELQSIGNEKAHEQFITAESNILVEFEEGFKKESSGNGQKFLTMSKYHASRTLILQLRYSTNGSSQDLSSVNRFRVEGAYAQARAALASSLQNGRVHQRRPCTTIERSAVVVATPSRLASKVMMACPTGDARAWEACPGVRLSIGESNGVRRRICRICFGQSSSEHIAIATTEGGVMICSTSEMSVVRELRAPRLDETLSSRTIAHDNVQALEFSPSDEIICLLSRGEVRLWRVIDGEILLTLGSKFTAIAFTPPTCGKAALACGDSHGNVQLIDCKALSSSSLRCPGIVRRKPERNVVLVDEQTVSQFGRAITAMTFEIPWARLFVADTFAKVHLLHRDASSFAVDSFVRFGNMVGIGESPQRVVSLRHVWRSTEFGKSRGAVLCLCWDKVVRLLAVGADEVLGGTQSQLQFVQSFSLAGTAWAAWRNLEGSFTCAHDALLRNVEVAFLSLDVEPIAAAAWRQPMGGVAATIVTHGGGLQFLGQLTPPADDKIVGPPLTSAPCGGGLLATDADGRSWASVAPNGSEIFVWRLHEQVAHVSNEIKPKESQSSKPLNCLIREDFPAVVFGRKKGTSRAPTGRSMTQCFSMASRGSDSGSESHSNRRYSLEDNLEDFLGHHLPDAPDEHKQGHEHIGGTISLEMQQLLDMGFTEAEARRALLLEEQQEAAKPSPLATLHKSLEAALSTPIQQSENVYISSPLKALESPRPVSPQRPPVELHLPDYDPPEECDTSPVAFSNNLIDFIGEEIAAPNDNLASERLTELLDDGPNVDLDQLQRCCEDAIGEMWAGAHHEQK